MIPIPFNQSYLPYQIEGIEFARGRSQVLFADEMGLGKTVEAIGVMNTRPEIGRALVVCPASLRVNWNRELAKFLVSPCVDIDITNYEQLHKLDLTKPYDLAILDEAHYIKNPETQRSQLCAKIKAETMCTSRMGTWRVMRSPNQTTGALASIMPTVVPATTQKKDWYCATSMIGHGFRNRTANERQQLGLVTHFREGDNVN